ncbi:MAG TPA: transposase, partial [Arachidicoccus soli]|nr:transposase [Arachidicoccus soli]
SKGFFPSITIQDFPLRGQRVFLHIKRRRWMKMEGEEKRSIITRDWNVVSKGTRMTKEFAAFLKECRRYPTI